MTYNMCRYYCQTGCASDW